MATPLRPLPSGSPPAAPSRRSRRLQNVLMGLAAVVAVNLLVAAAVIGGGSNDGPDIPAEIEQVMPAPGTTILSQADVGADLIDTYTGVLFIDGVEIPLDQLRIERALGQVVFRPGENKEITRLAPGPHRATIEYWPQDRDREASRSFTWQFRAG